ncbi:hypothetical protein [Sphingopyxis sp. MWB1]|uniref:hypothetical protein n=1 Tax=Sphingopyxis sp. MWB1 TaxID=1537715 RepID=UPI00068E678F|nr:hypothetical protein [Sphingopyxis sp. MWB1]
MTTTLLAQTGASLIVVLFVAWLVKAMGLGHEARIKDDAHAIGLAEDAEPGFGGTEVARDRAGFAALIDNGQGQMMLVRAHGNHFAARPVDTQTIVRLDKYFLILSSPDRRFGTVTLNLGKEAGRWASRMRRLAPNLPQAAHDSVVRQV